MKEAITVAGIVVLAVALAACGCAGGENATTIPVEGSDPVIIGEPTREDAEKAKPLLVELESLEKEMESLEHHSPEYIEAEGRAVNLRREIATLLPDLQEGYNQQGLLELKPINECMEYVEKLQNE